VGGYVSPNAEVNWSLMVAVYPLLSGIVAGAFVVPALYFVGRRFVLAPVLRLALLSALCFCAAAGVPLLLHLRRPERALNDAGASHRFNAGRGAHAAPHGGLLVGRADADRRPRLSWAQRASRQTNSQIGTGTAQTSPGGQLGSGGISGQTSAARQPGV
jgi:hypothetical protein